MSIVAVTGAAGRLGRRLVPLLTADPDVESIVAIDTLSVAAVPGVRPVTADLLSTDLAGLFAGARTVVHLALVSDTESDRRAGARVNLEGTKRVLDAATAAGVQHLVTVTTAMVYGAWPSNPVPLTEDAPVRPNPEFSYSVQRAQIEALVSEWAMDAPGRVAAVLRPTVALAAGEDDFLARALAAAAAVAIDSTNPPAQFLALDDLASAIDVVRRSGLDGPFNVAPDGWIPTETVRALTGSPPRVHLPTAASARLAELSWRFRRGPIPPGLLPYTMHPWVVSNDRLKSLGWSPGSSNEEAYVEGTEGSWWSMMSPKRRQEVALGSAGAGLAVGAAAAAGITRRLLRSR